MDPASKAGEAHIEGGEIVIRMPLANLQSAVLGGWANNNLPAIYIDNPSRFAVAFCNALNAEDEIGNTPIHGIFDDAVCVAFENGVGLEITDNGAEALSEMHRRGVLGEKMAEIEVKAIEKYEEGRKNVSGRPDWFSLDNRDDYDMGMREAAFSQVLADLGWDVQ